MLDFDSMRRALSKDYETQNPAERNTETFLAICRALHCEISIILLMVKLKNYATWGGSAQDGFMTVAFYSGNPKDAWNAR